MPIPGGTRCVPRNPSGEGLAARASAHRLSPRHVMPSCIDGSEAHRPRARSAGSTKPCPSSVHTWRAAGSRVGRRAQRCAWRCAAVRGRLPQRHPLSKLVLNRDPVRKPQKLEATCFTSSKRTLFALRENRPSGTRLFKHYSKTLSFNFESLCNSF